MIIIGERINATRKSIREAIQNKNAEHIAGEIARQDSAGAHYIDLNAGTGSGDLKQETDDLCWLIDIALAHTGKKLSIDAASPSVIIAAAHHLDNRRPWMINSVKAEKEVLDALLPLAVENQVPVIALAMDSGSPSTDMNSRLAIVETLVGAATAAGMDTKQLFVDPLAFPLATDQSLLRTTLVTIGRIKERYPEINTTVGLSNVSHGLPRRSMINQAFCIAALAYGLDSAICDPSIPAVKRGIVLGTLIAGNDRHCRRYTRAVRGGLFD
jgi:5-methyltetrahydrofolate--homocysteine methyltransferase